jgi:hypothetical protein
MAPSKTKRRTASAADDILLACSSFFKTLPLRKTIFDEPYTFTPTQPLPEGLKLLNFSRHPGENRGPEYL